MFFNEKNAARDWPYTDLACERRRADTSISGVDYKRERAPYGEWERLTVSSTEGAKSIGRPVGIYDTLITERMDLMDMEAIDDAAEEVARELCYLCDVGDILPARILVVGLGNPELTPDSIGPATAKEVRATMHIREFDEEFFEDLECSEIAVLTPGVASASGMDAETVVRGVCEAMKPDVVLAIDALASRSPTRLGTTVQMSNTGIFPGSGIGNGRRAISRETVGVPVLSIGVPTVIDSRMFWYDARGDGKLNTSALAREAMFVSPKEINEIVKASARIIAGGINQAFGLYY